MGGLGSGGHNRSHNRTLECYGRLRAADLKRFGQLGLGACNEFWVPSFGETVWNIHVKANKQGLFLSYNRIVDGKLRTYQQFVRPVWIIQNLGGEQLFFECPFCKRNTLHLYLAGAETFACRQCHGLVHESARTHGRQRLYAKARGLRGKLYAGPNLMLPPPSRPRHMRERRYKRLLRDLTAVEGALFGTIGDWAITVQSRRRK